MLIAATTKVKTSSSYSEPDKKRKKIGSPNPRPAGPGSEPTVRSHIYFVTESIQLWDIRHNIPVMLICIFEDGVTVIRIRKLLLIHLNGYELISRYFCYNFYLVID